MIAIMENGFRLNIELIPDACWASNLRHILRPKDWDTVRRDAYARADGKCTVCNRSVKRLEAHEKWEFDEEKCIQRLSDVVALCHMCHSVVHIGRTSLLEDEGRAISWFMRVNGCSYADYINAVNEANRVHQRRNRIPEWQLDVSWLSRFN